MNIKIHTSEIKEEIDQIESRLIGERYQISKINQLNLGEYSRSEWTGTESSFEGTTKYSIRWNKI